MTEQMGTPGSNADTSVNGAKAPAPKDKSCPFCRQPFTSSSLGRHLDLYIKEKNPKPADGVHDVDEIRKMRGGITRRQPRNSAARREVSTPTGTPGGPGGSPLNDSENRGKRSASRRKGSSVQELSVYCGNPTYALNKPSWEATGVINHIPSAKSDDGGRGWDGEEMESGRRMESRNRSVSRHMLAKTTFEQKEKLVEALDNARAAELALRELMGSLRAAKQRIDGGSIFDYNPLTLDFPSLVLKCLPPPPTLHQANPFPSSSSWSILPPDDQQYRALRAHFSEEFHRWRVSCTIATTTPNDDLSYPPQPFAPHEEPAEIARRAEEDSRELETQISEHLHGVFARWTALPPQSRTELWTLALARDIGSKSEEIGKLKKEREYSQQEISHLKLQVDELSRLQHPREFRLLRPETIPFDSRMVSMLGEKSVWDKPLVGWNLMGRNIHIDSVVQRAIGRWKSAVKEARNGRPSNSGKLSGQLCLSGEPLSAHSPMHQKPPSVDQPPRGSNVARGSVQMTNESDNTGTEPDADVDADADMEEDDNFVEMREVPLPSGQRGPEAALARAASFSLVNGYGGSRPHQQQSANERRGPVIEGMEGMENQTCVAGYVRIGA